MSDRKGDIERLKIGRGISTENDNGSWTKRYIEVEMVLPKGSTERDFDANAVATETMLTRYLESPETAASKGVEPTAPAVKLLMTPDDIDAMGCWKASKWVRKEDPDRVARTGEDAYMQETDANNMDPQLMVMLNENNGEVEMPGSYTLKYSRKEGFSTGMISRKGPRKEKQRK